MSDWLGVVASLIWARVQIVLPYQKWAVTCLKVVCPPLVRWWMDRRFVRVVLACDGEERMVFRRRFFRKRVTDEELRHFLEDIFQGRCDAMRCARHALSCGDQVALAQLGSGAAIVLHFSKKEYDECIEPRLAYLARRYVNGR